MGTIFVFGSNLAGIHGGGAARVAFKQYGAKWGVGEGRTGDSGFLTKNFGGHSDGENYQSFDTD